MAFVIVLHLSPKHESSAAEILQRTTGMPVTQIVGVTRVERDHVYVIPPTHGLSMSDGQLGLTDLEHDRGRHIVIDVFFRQLARAHKERAVAIVLSGTGADGSLGIGEIKEQGGIVLAQSPQDAEFDGMPASAIATGKVDIVLPVAEIPQRLLDIWKNAQRIELPAAQDADMLALPPTSPAAAEKALRAIMRTLQTRTGHDFKHYKRATLLRRVERRLQVNELPHLPAYREYLETHSQETPQLLDDMLIGVTNFFRDREAFEALERIVIPTFFTEADKGRPLRAWVPGCSSGEEAYSLLMLLCQEAETTHHLRPIQLFASDIDEHGLARGRAGRYPESIAADVPPSSLRKWLSKDDHHYTVRKQLREMVLFAQHNVLRDPPFSRVDLVSCRNLLIYLEREVQKEILQMFHFALRPGGYLFLGSSETADAASGLFTPVDKKNRIYRSVSTARAVRALPRFPLGGLEHKARVAPSAATSAPESVAELHRRLLLEKTPPSILVKPDGEIVHTLRAEQYLRFAPGVPTQNVFAAIQPELRPAIRSALLQATPGHEGVPAVTTKIGRAGHVFDVTVKAQAASRNDGSGDWQLLYIEESLEGPGSDEAALKAGVQTPAMHQLEAELQRKEQLLQDVIAQYESSVDDLRASNEELQAINEELRSTTEELETSKEELQSTNEELITVNHELKTKVEETVEINDDLQNLMSSSGIATLFVDRDMRIKRFAPPAATVFNIIATDVGRSLLDITHKMDYPDLAADAASAFGSLTSVEREVPSNDGRWFLARIVPYRTAEDRIDGAVLTFVDITTRHRAELTSQIDRESMQLVAESLPDFAILTLDEQGRITSWSPGAERLFGYGGAEVLGKSIDLIFTAEDRANGASIAEMRQARETGRATDERWHLRKDGSRVFVSGIMAPMRHGRGKGYAKIGRDMTARAHADSMRDLALTSAVQQASTASQASHLKDEFLAVMSHELKHPLNLIQVNAQLLLSLPEPARTPAIVKIAHTIQSTVKSQARIIDDLLDISRTRTGKLVLNRSVLKLEEALQSALTWGEEQAAANGINYTIQRPDHGLVVDADPVRIEQVALNLLSNAVKFTPEGGSVSVWLGKRGNNAVLAVSDTGRGINADLLPHVFELFKQGETSTTREHGGLGIGLALVRDIMDLHGGEVVAKSDGRGRGATFEISLPLRAIEAPAPQPAASPEGGLAGLTILCIDDSKETLELFAALLGMHGAKVVAAASGKEALAAANANIDLIISDIAMPQMDGFEVISQLRRRPELAKVPAIALTGYGRPQDVQQALAAGFTAHLNKPVDIERLRALVTLLVPRK